AKRGARDPGQLGGGDRDRRAILDLARIPDDAGARATDQRLGAKLDEPRRELLRERRRCKHDGEVEPLEPAAHGRNGFLECIGAGSAVGDRRSPSHAYEMPPSGTKRNGISAALRACLPSESRSFAQARPAGGVTMRRAQELTMTLTADLRCRCGEVEGRVANAARETVNRVVCYCDDCQAFLHHLGRADLPDAHGGSDIVQVAPASLAYLRGADRIAGLRLGPKGLYRWYAACCKTPLGNTLSPAIPFVGVIAQAF